MKHAVAIWTGDCESAEALDEYTNGTYDEEGEYVRSDFMKDTGIEWLDMDFMEIHYIQDEQGLKELLEYLRHDYSQDEAFRNQLPPEMDQALAAGNAVILLYGNDSLYGPVNEFLLRSTDADFSGEAAAFTIQTLVRYETPEK
ncbi:hypothetical protein GCM10010912_53210 [Paenibacillus albidus]|uniref:Immunity protein 22 n=1 Tax=Paenibacillus albidus TaxID=2041023 RepID=A0A917FU86_9BACL|nr:immunity 22 family protein [Paenibacillus albidus]GGG01715.1 hypothetical protein GCM10010912_53210 [Paenibacillus albidus]